MEAQASGWSRWAVLAAAAALLLVMLGAVGASAPDEPRYLQVAEEMRSMEHGPSGLVLLHLNGRVYTQKPPLYYWLAGLFGAPLGRVTEGAGRLPSALAGIATVWLTLRLGTRLFGGAAGVLGAGVLLSVFEFGHLARRVQLDVLLTLLEAGALVCFWWIDRGLASGRRWVALLHASLGLAVLTKGPVGFLVPALVMIAFLGWERRLRDLRRVFPAWAFLLSIGPGLAWVTAAAALAPPGFAEEAVGANVLGRFFTGTSHVRPFYYYLYQFPVDFLPWTLLWPAVLWAARRRVFAEGERGADEARRRAWRFLLAWVGASFVFFSLSSGKRGLYLLPAFPAMALLCSDALGRLLAGRAALPRVLRVGAVSFALLACAVAAEAILASLGAPMALRPELLEAIRTPLLFAFGCALAGVVAAGAVAWLVLKRNRAPLASLPAVAVATVLGIEAAVFWLLYPALDPITSAQPIAAAAAAASGPGEPIGLLGDRSMVGGLAYYARRRITPLDTPEEVRRFVDEGGAAIVVKRRKLDRVESVVPIDVVGRARTGRREVVVVVPRASPPGPS